MHEIPVQLNGPAGMLEGLYMDVADARGLMLLCHPNPEQGGSMLNKVISTLQRTARDAGYCTLRFNFRGTGASSGAHDMGQGEVDDAEAAALWLRAKHPGLPLSLAGFSFGGFVAVALANRLAARGEAPQRIILAAPALWRLPPETTLPEGSRLVVIQPENDEVMSPQSVYSWSQAHRQYPHELLKMAECGHFFHGKLIDLRDLVRPYL